MTKTQLIYNIGQAIAKMEGFFIQGSIANKNNSPGNLRNWQGVPTDGGFARFPSSEAGWKALYKQIENNIFGTGKRDVFPLRNQGLTLYQFFIGQRDADGVVIIGGYPGYAPGADRNRPEAYAKFVATQLGNVDIHTKLKDLITH